MPYWIDQPMNISKEDKIKILKPDIVPSESRSLPDGFIIKTLGLEHFEEIHNLLNNHYIEDDQHLVRLMYAKPYLYWYLKYIPSGFIVGLCYNKKLVGMITAALVDMIVYDQEIKVPYINFLCVQTKIRKLGLAEFLMEEIKSRLLKINITYGLFTSMKNISKSFCHTKDFIIPLNYPKLKKIEFLMEDLPERPKIDENPLHLLKATDIACVVTKLNNFTKKFSIKPYFTEDSGHHFLLPRKNIVYSFVNRNNDNIVTDYVTVYKHYLYCKEKNKMVSVGQLAFYFYETMTLTDLITFLLDKLLSYGIDQFVFRDAADNHDINITKFSAHGQLNYYFYNVSIKETDTSMICFYPF